MAHPQMFQDDDPAVRRVREIALAFPGAAEKISHGRLAFYTTKVFVYFGGSVKVDGEWIEHERSVMVQPDESDRRALLEDERVFVPAYLGPSGWIGIDLPPASTDDGWDEIGELIDASYRLTAGKRNIAELDQR